MREQEVTQAIPQNSCPTVAISTTTFCQLSGNDVAKTASELPAPLLIPATSVAAKVIARSTIQPPTPDQNTAPPKPELLIVSVKTKLTLWWVSGMKASTRTMTATPATCQKTEMLFS